MLLDHMMFKISPKKSYHIAFITDISHLPAVLCSLIMWNVNLGLRNLSNCTSHQGFSLTYRPVLFDHVQCQIVFLRRFLMYFSQEVPPPSHHLCELAHDIGYSCSCYWKILYSSGCYRRIFRYRRILLVVSTGAYYPLVATTGGFLLQEDPS